MSDRAAATSAIDRGPIVRGSGEATTVEGGGDARPLEAAVADGRRLPRIGADDTWYARSCLEPPLEAQPLGGRETASIGIVGGGLAGLALALSLVERGAAPVLLEAETIGAGASGRNGGLLSAGFIRGFESLERWLGEARARRLFQCSIDAVRLVEQRIDRGAIACKPHHGVLEASWFDRPRQLSAFVDAHNRLFDRDLRFWPREQLRALYRSAYYYDGIFDPQARHLDPLALCRGYARLARAGGAKLFERSCVVRIHPRPSSRPGTGGWRVETRHGGRLDVDRLVLATNAASPALHRRLARGLLPVDTYIIVSEPLPDGGHLPIRAGYAVYDDRFATGYYRMLEGRRLLWGGRIGLGSPPADLAARLRGDLARVYPELAGIPIAHAWAGRMGFARHRMPVVAPLASGLWVTTGFAGHGLNTTTMAGELVARALLEDDGDWRLLAPFGLAWTVGPLGPLAARALYHGHALKDGLVALWHRHRQRRWSRRTADRARLTGRRSVHARRAERPRHVQGSGPRAHVENAGGRQCCHRLLRSRSSRLSRRCRGRRAARDRPDGGWSGVAPGAR